MGRGRANMGVARRASVAALVYAVALQAFISGWTGGGAAAFAAEFDVARVGCRSALSDDPAAPVDLPMDTGAFCQCVLACLAGHHTGGMDNAAARPADPAGEYRAARFSYIRAGVAPLLFAGSASARGPPAGA